MKNSKEAEREILKVALAERYSRFNLGTAVRKATQELQSIKYLLPLHISSLFEKVEDPKKHKS